MEELIVRINALLRRNILNANEDEIEIGKYNFDRKKQILTFRPLNEPEKLTHREAALLHSLLLNRNELKDRKTILNSLWGSDDFFSARSMDVFITRLRKKLSKDPDIQILNVRGYGYKLVF